MLHRPMVARRIHVELVIGIAEHFALARNEVGVILAHEGVRRSEADLASFEVGVEADVFRFGYDPSLQHLRRAKAWFPLTELSFLPVNLGFRTSGEVETMRTGRTLHLRGSAPSRRWHSRRPATTP